MAVKTKDEPDTSTEGTINPDAPTKPSSGAKSRKRDKDSPASSKRRCVSTACIACRRRKSKVGVAPSWLASRIWLMGLDGVRSVTAIRRVALPAHPSMGPNVSMIHPLTIGARECTRKPSTV